MQKSCPICGAETFPGARFCRRCGAPLVRAGDGGEVSPQAATVPLADEGRSTDGLGADEPSHAADTTRVSRAELERLLRSQQTGDVVAPDLARRAAADAAPGGQGGSDTVDLEETLAARDLEETLIARDRTNGPHPPRGDEPGEELDEELTISVARPARDLATHETGAGALRHAGGGAHDSSGAPAGASSTQFTEAPRSSAPAGARPPSPAASPRRRWPLVVVLCFASLLFVAAAAWLAARFWRRPAPTDVSTQAPAAPAADPNQLLEEKLAEAEALLAQGNMDGAMAALREANRLVPSNAKAHRRLGELLLESGARREAIEEFRAVTRHVPDDFTAWRQLASAQFAEGLHRDAADSYRRVVELVGEQSADPNDLLSYADALRLSGRADEARALYQRLSALAFDGVASLARQRLAELSQPTPTPAPDGQPGDGRGDAAPPGAGETASLSPDVPTQPQPSPPAPTPQPAAPPAPARPAEISPAERYRRGVGLWSSNRAAALDDLRAAAGSGNPDAHYYLGLSYVEGRNLQGLKRAEIVAALGHFQNAQRGQFAGQARRYAQQLEREFDRIRRQ